MSTIYEQIVLETVDKLLTSEEKILLIIYIKWSINI